MSGHSQFSLLGSRRFAPFFATQSLGAFNDNAFRNALVVLVGYIGIYVASVLFVAFFMRWLGKYAWWKVGAVSVGLSVMLFVIFEIWFLVPLPKGPLERLLGVG